MANGGNAVACANCAMPSDGGAFVFEDPTHVDIFELCGCEVDSRSKFRTWTLAESDVFDCIRLVNPQQLVVSIPLMSASVPILSLTDALSFAGYTSARRLCTHTPNDYKCYDSRKLSVPYLQAVLAAEDLFRRGCSSFRSDKSNSYGNAAVKGSPLGPLARRLRSAS